MSSPRAPTKVSNYRHKKILEMLGLRQSVSADELAKEFGVSKITIRRDLDALAHDKLLDRTRGGAVSVSGRRMSREVHDRFGGDTWHPFPEGE